MNPRERRELIVIFQRPFIGTTDRFHFLPIGKSNYKGTVLREFEKAADNKPFAISG